MSKKSLVTGCRGQIGSWLMEILLEDGHEVHGLVRRTSQPINSNIEHLLDKITLHHGDMTDTHSIHKIIEEVKPDFIFNLAAMSQVRISYDTPSSTMDINCNGLLRIIESVRQLGLMDCRIYNAGSSEMFGKVLETPQKETTPFYPRSPYGCSKAAAFFMARIYRESYGMKIYSGILFNNESQRRGQEFVSRKICIGVAEIKARLRHKITLGNLEAKRDFGYSKEYAYWIYQIVKHDTPDDFVIATGETHSIKEFVELAFKHVGIDNWQDFVDYDKTLLRPAEVDLLMGDATKSKEVLGFEIKVRFPELVSIMMEHELKQLIKTDKLLNY